MLVAAHARSRADVGAALFLPCLDLLTTHRASSSACNALTRTVARRTPRVAAPTQRRHSLVSPTNASVRQRQPVALNHQAHRDALAICPQSANSPSEISTPLSPSPPAAQAPGPTAAAATGAMRQQRLGDCCVSCALPTPAAMPAVLPNSPPTQQVASLRVKAQASRHAAEHGQGQARGPRVVSSCPPGPRRSFAPWHSNLA